MTEDTKEATLTKEARVEEWQVAAFEEFEEKVSRGYQCE